MKQLFYFEFEVTPVDMSENYYVGAYGETVNEAIEKVLSVGLWIIEGADELIKKVRTCYQVSEDEIETSESNT